MYQVKVPHNWGEIEADVSEDDEINMYRILIDGTNPHLAGSPIDYQKEIRNRIKEHIFKAVKRALDSLDKTDEEIICFGAFLVTRPMKMEKRQ